MNRNGILTTHTLGWYGSFTSDSADYCLPFLIDDHINELDTIITLSNSSENLKFKAWNQSTPFDCGTAGIVYSKNNAEYYISEFHSGHLDQSENYYGVRPPIPYFTEFKVSGLTGIFFEANSDTGKENSKAYKLTDIVKNKKPVYKKVFENWFIFWNEELQKYLLADGLNTYTKYLLGQSDKPNGIFHSEFDTNITGISDGVEYRSAKTICEVEVSYDFRTYTGAYFKKQYIDYFESLGMKDDDNIQIVEKSRYSNDDGHLKIKELKLSTEIGRGFGTSVNPKFSQTQSSTGVAIDYNASVNEMCDVSSIEIQEQVNDGIVVDSLVERYDAKYALSKTVFDEVGKGKTLHRLSENVVPTITTFSTGEPSFFFNDGKYLTSFDTDGSDVFSSTEFTLSVKFEGDYNQVLVSRWKANDNIVFNTASFKLYGNRIQTFENTYVFDEEPNENSVNSLIVTFNRNTQRLNAYLNGKNVLSTETDLSDFPISSKEPFIIGGVFDTLNTIRSYVGKLNDIRIYDQEFFQETIEIIANENDYESKKAEYSFEPPFEFNSEPIMDGGVLFRGDLYSNNTSVLPHKYNRTFENNMVVGFTLNNSLFFEFYNLDETSENWTFSFQMGTSSTKVDTDSDYDISDSFFIVRGNNVISLYSLIKDNSGKITSVSLLSEINSGFSQGLLKINDTEDTLIVYDSNNNLVAYDVSVEGLTPKTFGVEINDVAFVDMKDDIIVVINSSNFYSVFQTTIGRIQLKHNTTISEIYPVSNFKLAKSSKSNEYYIITSYVSNSSTSVYPDRFKAMSYINHPVGYLKIRTLDSASTYTIESEPIQEVWPSYSEFGTEFFELESFGSSVDCDGINLVVSSPLALKNGSDSKGMVWWYSLHEESETFKFASRIIHTNSNEYSNFGKSISVKDGTCRILSKHINSENRHIILSEFELSEPQEGIIDFLNYGYNLIGWYEFNSIYAVSSEGETIPQKKYVVLDRSGTNNHLGCAFPSLPLNEQMIGPVDGGLTYKFDEFSFCNTNVDLINKSFTINIWYLPTEFSDLNSNTLISTRSSLVNETENGIVINADGTIEVGTEKLKDNQETEIVSKIDVWTMLTIVYNHEFKSLWTYLNGDLKKNTDNILINNISTSLTIGGTSNGINPFIGYIDDIKIYDIALPTDRISDEFEKSWKNDWMKT